MSSSVKVIRGLFWSFSERFSAQVVSFFVSIMLARLLLPTDYGIVVMVLVFINIANSFVTGGLGNSLVQKLNADDLDFSSVFFFSMGFSIVIYIVIYLIAPRIEKFYSINNLALVMRVLGIRLLFTGINSVQKAFVARTMQFRKFFIATLGGTVVSAIIGIWMAYNGFGVWALVSQYLTNTITNTFILWFTVKWRPRAIFSYSRLRILLKYGWKLLLASVLSSIYVELNSLVIGKVYTSADLAFYSKGKKFPGSFVTNVNTAVETVLFPSMSQKQNQIIALKKSVRNSIQFSTYVIFPLVFGLAAISRNLILILLTDKWINCVPYLIIACMSYALIPIGMTNLQAIKAIGKSGVYLSLDIIKKIIGILLLVIFVNKGVLAIALAEMFSNIVGFFFNIFPNKYFINYSFKEQFKDVFPALCMSCFMFIIVFLENYIRLRPMLILIVQVMTGIFVYLGLSIISHNQTLNYIFRKIKFKVKKY